MKLQFKKSDYDEEVKIDILTQIAHLKGGVFSGIALFAKTVENPMIDDENLKALEKLNLVLG